MYIRDAHRAITKDMASTLVFNSRHPEYKVTVNVKSKWHQQIPGWDIYIYTQTTSRVSCIRHQLLY